MIELNIVEWRALITPQQKFRCLHCAKNYEDPLDDRAYTTQVPFAVIISHSIDKIQVGDYPMSYVNPLMETRCEVCGKRNRYPLNYWEENHINERDRRREIQSFDTTARKTT